MALLSDRLRKELALIIEANADGRRLDVSDLQKALGVSQATIYSDLEHLGTLRVARNRGAIELRSSGNGLPPRFSLRGEIKRAVAVEVVSMLSHGAVTYLDTGSTCFFIAKQFVEAERDDIRLVTSNPFALATCLTAGVPSDVVLLGGTLRREAASLHGELGEAAIRRFAFDVAIISVDFIHPDANATIATFSDAELEQKRLAIERASQVIVVADTTKIGRPLGHPVIELRSVLQQKRVRVVLGSDDSKSPSAAEELADALGPEVVRLVGTQSAAA